MLIHSCLPSEVRITLEGLRNQFYWRHYLIFSWLVFLQMLNYGPGNLMELQRMSSAVSYFQLTRFLKSRGHWPNLWLWWLAKKVLSCFPPPENGILYITVDMTRKAKRSKRNPALTKGKDRNTGPWILGLHILVISFHWHSYRIPVAFALIRPKSDPKYVKPNLLLQNLLSILEIPQWARQVIVLADLCPSWVCWLCFQSQFSVLSEMELGLCRAFAQKLETKWWPQIEWGDSTNKRFWARLDTFSERKTAQYLLLQLFTLSA